MLLAFVLDGAIGLAALLVSVAAAPLVAATLLGDRGDWVLIAGFAIGVVFRAPITAANDVLTTLGSFRVQGILRGANALNRLVATLVALAISQSVGALVIGFGVGMALEAVAVSVGAERACRSELGGSIFTSGLSSLRGQRRELGRFVAYSDLSSLLRVLATQADLIVLGVVASPMDVGLYRLARQIIAPVSAIITPIQTVLYQRFAQEYEANGYSALVAMGTRVRRRIAWPLGVAFLAAVPFAGWVVRIRAALSTMERRARRSGSSRSRPPGPPCCGSNRCSSQSAESGR